MDIFDFLPLSVISGPMKKKKKNRNLFCSLDIFLSDWPVLMAHHCMKSILYVKQKTGFQFLDIWFKCDRNVLNLNFRAAPVSERWRLYYCLLHTLLLEKEEKSSNTSTLWWKKE